MDLSDEQLREIFSRLDADRDDWITMDELLRFARDAGASDTTELEALDPEGTGLINFESFASGVNRLLTRKEPPRRRTGGRKQLPKPIRMASSSEEVLEAEVADGEGSPVHSEVSPNMNGRHAMTKPSPAKPRLPHSAPPSAAYQDADLVTDQKEISRLQKELAQAVKAQKDAQEELKELKRKNAGLERRCSEYETQLKIAEEESYDADNTGFASKLKAEKTQLEIQLNIRVQVLEEQLAQAQLQCQKFKAEADAARRELNENAERMAQIINKQMEAEREVAEIQATYEAKVEEIQTKTQTAMQETVATVQERLQTEIIVLREEVEVWKERLETEKREFESNKNELETELVSANNKYVQLERALADPREYERLFIKKGMEIAAIGAGETGESLAAELSDASRDELMKKVNDLAKEIRALRAYIDKLVAKVIERVPEILEIRGPRM